CEEFHCASMNYKYPCGDGDCVLSGIEICNGEIHPHLIEDENDCDEWKRACNLKYRPCDGIINCFDAQDELNCRRSNKQCRFNEKNIDCFRYPNPLVSRDTCLPLLWIDDGEIDCFAGVDEDINYCARNYPQNATTRFHCYNDSKCIPLEDVCDGIFDCPYQDDETICTVRLNDKRCPPGTYFCNERFDRITCATKHIRCDGIAT
ncbi:unnamed protein product, partial [Rotaria sordida]